SILVIKLDEIGDFVLVTPFLRELRRNAPRARITLVVKPAALDLAETWPHVNTVLAYDGQTRGLRAWQIRRQWRAWQLARCALRPLHCDVAVIPRWGEDAYNATHLARYSGASAVIAYTEAATSAKQAMNRGFDRLVTHAVPVTTLGHEVEHNLRLIEQFGGRVESTLLEIWLTDGDRDFATAMLPAEKKFAAFAPGALDPARRWPADRYAALAQWLQQTHGLASVVLGSIGDPALPGVIDLRGRATLRQAAAVLARCRLFIGNDTGLKHLAAAVGTPVVELSAFRTGADPNHGNSPARFHAWGVSYRIVQPAPVNCAPPLAIEENSFASAQAACAELLAQT
ncbi:MAG: glycosyltransferase family 9 protein, partial [Verrucomicrobiota bacterium]|nr:glycosyltransferase family 9 protein [Verrucomicrobiota bacterium]